MNTEKFGFQALFKKTLKVMPATGNAEPEKSSPGSSSRVSSSTSSPSYSSGTSPRSSNPTATSIQTLFVS